MKCQMWSSTDLIDESNATNVGAADFLNEHWWITFEHEAPIFVEIVDGLRHSSCKSTCPKSTVKIFIQPKIFKNPPKSLVAEEISDSVLEHRLNTALLRTMLIVYFSRVELRLIQFSPLRRRARFVQHLFANNHLNLSFVTPTWSCEMNYPGCILHLKWPRRRSNSRHLSRSQDASARRSLFVHFGQKN